MKRVCCVCKCDMGVKQPYDDDSVTHGYCSECLAEAFAKLEARTWHEWEPRNAFNTRYGICKGFDRDRRGGGGRSDF